MAAISHLMVVYETAIDNRQGYRCRYMAPKVVEVHLNLTAEEAQLVRRANKPVKDLFSRAHKAQLIQSGGVYTLMIAHRVNGNCYDKDAYKCRNPHEIARRTLATVHGRLDTLRRGQG
jgi:hypothetical protein